MPELEPITREEMLLDGQDLEPITRKEMFIKRIYDKTQVIPEPITREEMFLKKAGDETTDVTIEQLSVSENGTYSEEGVAYSPVIVNVPVPPIPDNAYLLKDFENVPSDIVTFSDGANLPMPSLKVGIEPIQEGSGDPSPTNIRPIRGWSAVDVTVADDVDNPTTTKTITIQLGDTYYGGKLDVVSGVLTVDRAYVDLGTLDWTYQATNKVFYTLRISDYLFNSSVSAICSQYGYIGTVGGGTASLRDDEYNGKCAFYYLSTGVSREFYIKDLAYDDATAFKTAMNGVQLVYELATPLTIQLTPTAVKSLLGSNNVWGDCGQITEVSYFSKGEEE